MTTSVRKQVEDAIVNLLLPMKVAGALRSVKPSNAEIRADLADPARLTGGQYPAVLVQTADGVYRDIQVQRGWNRLDLNVELFLIAQSVRAREENVRDDIAGVESPSGAYYLMEQIQTRVGVKLLPESSLLTPTDEQVVMRRPDLSVWRMGYQITVTTQPLVPVAPPLLVIDAQHFLPDDEGILATGFGDGLAFSAGAVTLSDAGAAFITAEVGAWIEIEGATSAGNIGRFPVVAVPSATTIQFTNPAGVTETYAGKWTLRVRPFVHAQSA